MDIVVDQQTLDLTTAELVEYLRGRSSEIGLMLAQRYRAEIIEYRSLPTGFIEQDVAVVARRNFEDVLSGLSGHDPVFETHLQAFRDSAVRRFQQGVPIHALLQAYRMWGHAVWEQVLNAPLTEQNPTCALIIAGRIMKHVDLVSTTVTQAYLQKASGLIHDRETIRRDLIEALVTGAATERIVNYASVFRLNADARHFVILIRDSGRAPSAQDTKPLHIQLRTVEHYLAEVNLRSSVVCIRGDEIVAICPAVKEFASSTRQVMDALAQLIPALTVGVGRTYDSLAEVTRSYVDAQDSIRSAGPASAGRNRRAYLFSDALLDRVVKSSAYNDDLEREVLAPLGEYDDAHRTDLIPTLRAYIDSGFSLAHTAQIQHVQPNTIKYRLQRISVLTGHDPLDPKGILLFALALVGR